MTIQVVHRNYNFWDNTYSNLISSCFNDLERNRKRRGEYGLKAKCRITENARNGEYDGKENIPAQLCSGNCDTCPHLISEEE